MSFSTLMLLGMMGGRGAGWNPSRPTVNGYTPLVWEDISDPTTVYQESTKTNLSTAQDDVIGCIVNKGSLTGKDSLQTTAGSKPILKLNVSGNMRAAYFDGTDDRLVTAAFAAELTQPTTIFFVSANVPAMYGRTQALMSGITATKRNQIYISTSGNPDSYYAYAGSAVAIAPPMTYTPHVFAVTFNGAASIFRKDGVQIGAGNFGTDVLSGISTGSDHTPASFFKGYYFAKLVYGELQAADVVQIESYLIARFVTPHVPAYSLSGLTSSVIAAGGVNKWYGRASCKTLTSGVVVMLYAESTAHTDQLNSKLHIRFSDNYGATWSAEDKTLAGASVTGFPAWPTGGQPGVDAEGPGEPWLYLAPNGDLICHMWKAQFGVTAHGTWQIKSSDGGVTWGAVAQVNFIGIVNDDMVFATDDDFVYDGVIYAAARVYSDVTPTTSKSILIKSTDSGITWEYVSDITTTTNNTIEVGLEYVGSNNIVAIARSTSVSGPTYKITSTDMGATWSAATIISTNIENSGRHRIYTKTHLQGGASWWLDPVLIMVGYVHTDNGQNMNRRSCVWVSLDSGATWSYPLYFETAQIYEDGGYGDIFYDHLTSQYVVEIYRGTLTNASLVQYKFSITGIPA